MTPTNPTEVTSIISSLPNKTSSGYDHFNNKLLKEIKSEIATPLSIVFNYSLETGCFPTKMKYAEVVPLYKSKSKLDPTSYRPISLLITISKTLEKIIIIRYTKVSTVSGQNTVVNMP